MAVQLSPADVLSMTAVEVSASDIAVAADVIDTQTGYTPDEHSTERDIGVESVRLAWAIVASRVHVQASVTSVTAESQGDYSYSEDSVLASYERFADLTDGMPRQLLNLSKALWAHI